MATIDALPLLNIILIVALATRTQAILCNDLVHKIASFLHLDLDYLFKKAQEVMACVDRLHYIREDLAVSSHYKKAIKDKLSMLHRRQWRMSLTRHIPSPNYQFNFLPNCDIPHYFWFYCIRGGGVIVHSWWGDTNNTDFIAEARMLKT